MKIVADQHGADNRAELARLTLNILMQDPKLAHAGLYHDSGAGETTWYGFAAEIVRPAAVKQPGKPYATLLPIRATDYPTPARPARKQPPGLQQPGSEGATPEV